MTPQTLDITAIDGVTHKAALFEGGIGVPFIARWPGVIPAGKVDGESLISAVDLLPTFCEIARSAISLNGVLPAVKLYKMDAKSSCNKIS